MGAGVEIITVPEHLQAIILGSPLRALSLRPKLKINGAELPVSNACGLIMHRPNKHDLVINMCS
jgi:hypothetical protein